MNATVIGPTPPRDNLNRLRAARSQSANKPENKNGTAGLRLVKNGTRHEEATSIFIGVDKFTTNAPERRLAITNTLAREIFAARNIEGIVTAKTSTKLRETSSCRE